MKHPRSRAERRFNKSVKVARVEGWHALYQRTDRDVKILAVTPARCSCDLCGKQSRTAKLAALPWDR